MDKKIIIGIPHHTPMDARFHLSLTNLAHTLSLKDYEVDLRYAEGTVLSTQRNQLAKAAWQGEYDLLSIDSDMTFSVSDAFQVMSTPGEVVGGLCFKRRFPYEPVVFCEDLVETDGVFRAYRLKDIPDKPFPCKGVGTAMLMIRHSALVKLYDAVHIWGPPFNFYNTIRNDQLGEDLSFCHRCNQLGIEMICVPTVDIGHMTQVEIKRADHILAVTRDHHYCNDVPGKLTVGEQNWLYNMAKLHQPVLQVFEDAKVERTLGDVKWNSDGNYGPYFKMIFFAANDNIRDKIKNYDTNIEVVAGNGYLHNPIVHATVNETFGVENIKTYEGIWYFESQ